MDRVEKSPRAGPVKRPVPKIFLQGAVNFGPSPSYVWFSLPLSFPLSLERLGGRKILARARHSAAAYHRRDLLPQPPPRRRVLPPPSSASSPPSLELGGGQSFPWARRGRAAAADAMYPSRSLVRGLVAGRVRLLRTQLPCNRPRSYHACRRRGKGDAAADLLTAGSGEVRGSGFATGQRYSRFLSLRFNFWRTVDL